jgi:peroxiredoxin
MPTKIVEGRKAPGLHPGGRWRQRVSLADFKGKNVIVYFYPKDDTPGCTKEAGSSSVCSPSNGSRSAAIPAALTRVK